jgi:hypothetical protein
MSQEQNIISEMTRLCGFPVVGLWEKAPHGCKTPTFAVSATPGHGMTIAVHFSPDEVVDYERNVISMSQRLKASFDHLKSVNKLVDSCI